MTPKSYRDQVIEFLQRYPVGTLFNSAEISEHTGFSVRTVNAAFKKLYLEGTVEPVGTSSSIFLPTNKWKLIRSNFAPKRRRLIDYYCLTHQGIRDQFNRLMEWDENVAYCYLEFQERTYGLA